ncbi:hypothetical protein HanRHA438_Chr14g0662051 [Helianthus annuus]|nr:hypothetical protein HanIR_Chr14g0706561 [Helianthus annuus]KAJ0854388.1 hypothetical protein HanRHA438_Chr14g0662051 [Helianthus annuus]
MYPEECTAVAKIEFHCGVQCHHLCGYSRCICPSIYYKLVKCNTLPKKNASLVDGFAKFQPMN